MNPRVVAVAVAAMMTTVALAPSAFAQTGDSQTQTAPPKKPKKKKPKAPAATDAAPAADATPPTPAPPAPDPSPAPPPPAEAAPPPAEPAPAATEDSITDVTEKAARTYYFIGLRYRGDVLPKFMMNMFVNEGATIFSNQIGVELDIRRDDFSFIPWVEYRSYGTGDMLFWQKGQPDEPQYYSDVQSNLAAIYVGADILWSKKISENFQFEYGAGFGIGFLFGSLVDDWVYQTPGGPLTGSNGNTYAPCQTVSADVTSSCNPNTHSNATVNKVGGYQEPNWAGGGSVPMIFPHLALPELGIRYKPIKQLETRVSVGFSLTGFFFGLSADYGLEPKKDGASAPRAARSTSD